MAFALRTDRRTHGQRLTRRLGHCGAAPCPEPGWCGSNIPVTQCPLLVRVPTWPVSPSATSPGYRGLLAVPKSPQVGGSAAQTEDFTPKPPEQRPSPTVDPPCPQLTPQSWPRSHQTTSFRAIKALGALSGAPKHGGDRLAARGDVLGVHGGPTAAPRAGHRVSSHRSVRIAWIPLRERRASP